MSNKHMAINWASKMVRSTRKLVYSDKFFQPFSNLTTRQKIVRELDQAGVVVWSDTKIGAFLIPKNDSRLTVSTDGQVKIGAWCDGETIVMLPVLETV